MTKSELQEEYFEWMCDLVSDPRYSSFDTLLRYLHGTEFTYILPMDGNRAEDGVDLRYRFGYERSYPDPMVATYLDCNPCSVLEMMVALSIRCEEHIMGDPDVGDRTSMWFWEMISNLGLMSMTDDHFNEEKAERIILRFLEREYAPDGHGGLFTVENCSKDLRRTEIWYQMCWYLNDIA